MATTGVRRSRWVCCAMVYIAAARGSPCTEELEQVVDFSSQFFFKYAYAWGNSLPLDAGKYRACVSRQVNGRYFLVSMTGDLIEKAKAHGSFESWSSLLAIGVCAPESCNASSVEDFMKTESAIKLVPGLSLINVTTANTVSSKMDLQEMKPLSYTVLFICGIPICAVLAASLQRKMCGDAESGEVSMPSEGLFVRTFAMNGPSGAIAKISEPIPPRPTDCFNGIRVLSLAWIVFAHTVYYTAYVTGFADPVSMNVAQRNPMFVMILSAEFAVDTMFFLSAFLFAQLIYKQLEKSNGRLPVVMAILQRYLRLTPSLAFALMIYAFVWPYILGGPFAPMLQTKVAGRCYKWSWWSELAYTMNFWPKKYSDTCMTWTWYLGNDMFFFIAGLPIAMLHYRNEQLGTLLLCFLALASTVLTAGIIWGAELSVNVTEGKKYDQYIDLVYGKPYCRIPAYLVGMATSWTVRSLERRGVMHGRGVQTPCERLAVSTIILVTLLVVLVITFVPGLNYVNPWNAAVSALFVSLSRPCWTICCAILTLCCYYDFTPVARQFLSSDAFLPYVRLSYGIYISHPVIIQWYAGTQTQFLQVGFISSVLQFIMLWTLSCIAALFLWVVVESPSMVLTGMLKSGAARTATLQPQGSGPTPPDRGSMQARGSSAGSRIQALPSNMSTHSFAADVEQDLVSNLSSHSFTGDRESPLDHASTRNSACKSPSRSFGVASEGSMQIELGNSYNKKQPAPLSHG